MGCPPDSWYTQQPRSIPLSQPVYRCPGRKKKDIRNLNPSKPSEPNHLQKWNFNPAPKPIRETLRELSETLGKPLKTLLYHPPKKNITCRILIKWSSPQLGRGFGGLTSSDEEVIKALLLGQLGDILNQIFAQGATNATVPQMFATRVPLKKHRRSSPAREGFSYLGQRGI